MLGDIINVICVAHCLAGMASTLTWRRTCRARWSSSVESTRTLGRRRVEAGLPRLLPCTSEAEWLNTSRVHRRMLPPEEPRR